MADYVSSLNGVQMDSALMDMAEHNSEAWAVGERNGIPVGSDDVTYQNNAQYYASQAQSIAPASVTEAVRWDIAQTALTDANKEQARTNIDAGKNGAWTNPNLLDNSFFTVNQRGATSGTSVGYFIDRWKLSLGGGGSVSWALSSGVLSITGTATFLEQKPMEDVAWMVGKVFTLSVMLSDGTVESGTFTRAATTQTIFTSTNYYAYMGANGFIGLYINGSVAIKAVKLEVGSVSTLANDAPPDYGTELRKCQRYFYRMGNATYLTPCVVLAENSTNAYGNMQLPVPMRAQPTLTYSGSFICWTGNAGTSIAITNISMNNPAYPSVNPVTVNFRVQTASGLNTGERYDFQSGNDTSAYIALSADL